LPSSAANHLPQELPEVNMPVHATRSPFGESTGRRMLGSFSRGLSFSRPSVGVAFATLYDVRLYLKPSGAGPIQKVDFPNGWLLVEREIRDLLPCASPKLRDV
jgi:hypothetical protein